MKKHVYLAGAALALSACGQQQERADQTAGPINVVAGDAVQAYSGAGTVTAKSGDQVTIDHGPIDGIGWPAMTMAFGAPPGMADAVKVGSEVSFAFRDQDGTYVLTSIQER